MLKLCWLVQLLLSLWKFVSMYKNVCNVCLFKAESLHSITPWLFDWKSTVLVRTGNISPQSTESSETLRVAQVDKCFLWFYCTCFYCKAILYTVYGSLSFCLQLMKSPDEKNIIYGLLNTSGFLFRSAVLKFIPVCGEASVFPVRWIFLQLYLHSNWVKFRLIMCFDQIWKNLCQLPLWHRLMCSFVFIFPQTKASPPSWPWQRSVSVLAIPSPRSRTLLRWTGSSPSASPLSSPPSLSLPLSTTSPMHRLSAPKRSRPNVPRCPNPRLSRSRTQRKCCRWLLFLSKWLNNLITLYFKEHSQSMSLIMCLLPLAYTFESSEVVPACESSQLSSCLQGVKES